MTILAWLLTLVVMILFAVIILAVTWVVTLDGVRPWAIWVAINAGLILIAKVLHDHWILPILLRVLE